MTNLITAHFEARDQIVEAIGQAVPGTDLVEILARSIAGEEMDGMTTDEVRALVITVARQRIEQQEA